MRLVVGLGNPGNDYRNTYHNMGFDAVDVLAARFHVPAFSYDKRSDAELSDFMFSDDKVVLCKPQTYMNLSGNSVSALARYYKIPTTDILIMYDDIDIPKGSVRARLNGSGGTHNGMRDIIDKLGSTEFPRVRIGTGFKPSYMGLADYVLSHIRGGERELLDAACVAAADFVEQWLKGEEWQMQTVSVG